MAKGETFNQVDNLRGDIYNILNIKDKVDHRIKNYDLGRDLNMFNRLGDYLQDNDLKVRELIESNWEAIAK